MGRAGFALGMRAPSSVGYGSGGTLQTTSEKATVWGLVLPYIVWQPKSHEWWTDMLTNRARHPQYTQLFTHCNFQRRGDPSCLCGSDLMKNYCPIRQQIALATLAITEKGVLDRAS